MNIFQTILIDSILLVFPLLIYLIYLSNTETNNKKIYFISTLLISFLLLYRFGNNNKIIILLLSSIVLISYLEDNIIISNVLGFLISLIFFKDYNNTFFLLITYVIIDILYILKLKKILFIESFIFINSIIFTYWIYKYNNLLSLEIINILFGYILISNILCLLYSTSKSIIKTNITIKELQKEKQIRLSLFKITHEIKNPIAVCKGYLDMLNIEDKKQVKKYIPIIKSEIERLLILLQDFLLINKNNLDLDIMDFNLLIEETINKLESLIKRNNISIKLNLIDDEVYINGDYNRLSQVILNILKNSIESIEKKGKIIIKSKIENNNYILSIKDNGIGMTKEVLDKIREPFFTTKQRGSGLGISLIYEIVEAHKGKVTYNSKYKEGTEVIISIPIYVN